MSSVGRKDFAVVIGKGNAYTASTVNTLANGDIALVKRDMTLYDETTDSYTTSDEIFIAQGTASGVKFVGPIQGANVSKFTGANKVTSIEQVTHIGNVGSGALAIVANNSTEYTLHVLVKSDKELGSERTPRITFNYTSDSTATQQEIADAFVAKINASEAVNTDIVALTVNNGANYGIRVTGKAVTYDPVLAPTYRKVCFELFVEDGFNVGGSTPVTYTTAMDPGNGQFAQVRELEYTAQGYDGFTNRRLFPVITPTSDVVVGTEYDTYCIEYFDRHQGGNMELSTLSFKTVFVFVPTGSAQTTQFEAKINDYMASAPGRFAAVNI